MVDSISYKSFLNVAGSKQRIERFKIDRKVRHSVMFLKEKLYRTYDDLNGKQFKITWKDDDGDDVIINSNESLSIALNEQDGPVYRIYLEVLEDEKYDNTHPGVVCDGCEKPVVGNRYKCLVCADYDLCRDCEIKDVHPDHNMMRMTSIEDSIAISQNDNMQKDWHQNFFQKFQNLKKMTQRNSQRNSRNNSADNKNRDSIKFGSVKVNRRGSQSPAQFKDRSGSTNNEVPIINKNINKEPMVATQKNKPDPFRVRGGGKEKKVDKVRAKDHTQASNKKTITNDTPHKMLKPQISEPILSDNHGIENPNKQEEEPCEDLGDANQDLPIAEVREKIKKRIVEKLKKEGKDEDDMDYFYSSDEDEWKIMPRNSVISTTSDSSIELINHPSSTLYPTLPQNDPTPQVEKMKTSETDLKKTKTESKLSYAEASSVNLPPVETPSHLPHGIHHNDKILVALQAMLNMGFTDEGGWLTGLLEAKDGDIGLVLEILGRAKR